MGPLDIVTYLGLAMLVQILTYGYLGAPRGLACAVAALAFLLNVCYAWGRGRKLRGPARASRSGTRPSRRR